MGGLLNTNCRRRVSLAGAARYNIPIKYIDRIFSEHVLIYCLKGEYEIYDNDILYTLHSGDIIFQHAGIHHYGLKLCEPDTTILYVHFNCNEKDSYVKDKAECDSNSVFIPTLIHAESYPTVKRIFQRVTDDWIEMADQRDSEYHLTSLINYVAKIANKSAFTDRDIINRCLSIMQNNPDKYLTTREYAKMLFVSESTVRNSFRVGLGRSLYEIQRDYKIELVKEILSDNPDIKLHEVAERAGYCDEYQMSKLFKKFCGVTPSQYRTEAKNGHKKV